MTGQITKIISNLYTVTTIDGNTYNCHSRGKFRKEKIIPLVGDYVEFDNINNYILKILPRKNTLIRPMVCNIDQAIIITSLKNPDFSLNLLDKLIAIMEYYKVKPIICITKMDLINKEELNKIKQEIKYYNDIGYSVFYNDQIEEIKQIFKDKTTVFTGQTGAGKSTLLNRLDMNLNLETGEVSKALGRGRHTTRHVELINMYQGKVLDTPGFSSISFSHIPKEKIKDLFIEFKNYPCIYKDCNHIEEKECKIKEAVFNNNILKSRYENYIKIIQSR